MRELVSHPFSSARIHIPRNASTNSPSRNLASAITRPSLSLSLSLFFFSALRARLGGPAYFSEANNQATARGEFRVRDYTHTHTLAAASQWDKPINFHPDAGAICGGGDAGYVREDSAAAGDCTGAVWKIRGSRACRASDKTDSPCFLARASGERRKLPKLVRRRLSEVGGGSPFQYLSKRFISLDQ